MSKVQITLGFDTFAEALRVLAAIDGAPAQMSLQPSAEKPTVTAKPAPAVAPQQPSTEKPVEQAASSGVTQDDVRKSFAEYVGKGGGRTAATGKAILTRFGVPSVREAPADKWAGLKRAFDTAGPELPLGE